MIKSDLLHVYYKVFQNQKYSLAFIISPGKRFESNICKRHFSLPSPSIVFSRRSKRFASHFQAANSYLLQVNLQTYCLSFISIFVLVFTSIKPWIIHVTKFTCYRGAYFVQNITPFNISESRLGRT